MASASEADAAALSRSLGLTQDELATAEAIFVEMAATMGVDGRRVFDGLKRGQPLGQALAIPAGVAELLYARAHKWFAVGRFDLAESLFRTLCTLDGGSADNWVGYGICLQRRSAFGDAIVALETAATLRPDWAVPRFYVLEVFVRSEKWLSAAAALAAFDARARGDPGLPLAIVQEAERFRTALEIRRYRGPPRQVGS